VDAGTLNSITDVAALRRIALDQLSVIGQQRDTLAERDQRLAAREALIAEHERTLAYRQTKIDALTAEIARLRRWQFSARSERMDPAQRALFEEQVAQDIAAVEAELAALTTPAPTTPARRQPKRDALPAHLFRIEHRHEPESCQCASCGGALTPIGEDVSEQLDCEPVRFFVHRHVRPKFACRSCQTITSAPVPAAIIDRGMAAPGLLAYVLVSKYADHLPLYRQESIYRRSGVELARSTLASWVGASGVALKPLVDAMRLELLTQPVLHADETPLAVLDPGAGQTQRAYVFAYRSADPDCAPIVVFDFCGNRSGRHADRFLGDYRGALMVDDFGGYKALFTSGKMTELACLAHIRRKFFDLHAAGKSVIAQEALERIAGLYRVEAEARELDRDARHAYRQQHALPRLTALRAWLDELRPKVSDGSGTAKAIDYTLKRWAALIRYVGDGRYPIDNNPLENAIRPIALGRRNWLFAGSESAGQRAAAIMSLIATAKANGHDPHAYLKDVLTRLPTQPNRRIDELLPHRWQPAA
jgi:transposase